MKQIKWGIFSLITLFMMPIAVEAAGSASLSVNKNSIEQGSNVTATVTVRNTAAWNIKISGSGATSGCSASYADATSNGSDATKTFTVTCNSTKTGKITFNYSGDVTSADGSNTSVSGSKTVTVTAPREKSNNNNLKTLSIEGYTMSPEFHKDILEYRVEIPSEIEKITINASKDDGYASLDGTGEKEIAEGENRLEIKVTSETGKTKTYVIIVTVKDNNPIEINLNNAKFTVVKKVTLLSKPELFEETKVTINEIEVPAFYHEKTKITLVGLKDEEGNIGLYVYDEKRNTYTKYQSIVSSPITLIHQESEKPPKSYQKITIKIDDQQYGGYQYSKSKEFVLLYGINLENGSKGWYVYHTTDKTLQQYNQQFIEEIENQYTDQQKEYKMIIFALGIFSITLLIILLIVVVARKKKKKNKKLKKEIPKEESEVKEQF